MKTLILFGLACFSQISFGEDVTTRSGKKYTGIKINRVDPDGISILYDSGIAKIPFTDLSDEICKQYGYDPQKAAEFKAAAQQEAAKRRSIAGEEAAKEEAKKIEKQKVANAVRLNGRIIQATNEGLLIECGYYAPRAVASGSQRFGGGGGSYGPTGTGKSESRPKDVYGTFWLVGHTMQSTKVDRDPIDVDAYEDGIFSYTAANGAAKRIKKYKAVNIVE